MANFRLNVEKAIFETLNVSAVLLKATGGVYNTQATKKAKPPYVIFQMSSKEDEHAFSARYANAVYIVKAVSASQWPKEALDVDTEVDTVLEDATLTIVGYGFLLCRRESDFTLTEIVNGTTWQHIGGLYRIMADQS